MFLVTISFTKESGPQGNDERRIIPFTCDSYSITEFKSS